MKTIIKSRKTLLWISRNSLPPIGYKNVHGIRLLDGRWLWEIQKDFPNVKYGSRFCAADRVLDVDGDN